MSLDYSVPQPLKPTAFDKKTGLPDYGAVVPPELLDFTVEIASCGCVALADGTGIPCSEHHPDTRSSEGGCQ